MNLLETELKALEVQEQDFLFDKVSILARCSLISCQKYDGVSMFAGDSTGILLGQQDVENIAVNEKTATVLIGTNSGSDTGIYRLTLAGVSDTGKIQKKESYVYVK